jgi:hypothetical protein
VTCLFFPLHFVKLNDAAQYRGGDQIFPQIHFKPLKFNVLPVIEKRTDI